VDNEKTEQKSSYKEVNLKTGEEKYQRNPFNP